MAGTILPIYLGPILVFTLGYSLVRRILAQAKAQHSTSIADFLSARYGKSASVAALVTIIATIGSLPYMALQLQSVGSSLLALDPSLQASVTTDELVLLVAGAMALFAILFGSRRADRAGDNAGLVSTIAVESVVKLVALMAVAGLAAILLLAPQAPAAPAPSPFSTAQFDARFAVLTLIAACAALCLPRQFHMSFVEAQIRPRDSDDAVAVSSLSSADLADYRADRDGRSRNAARRHVARHDRHGATACKAATRRWRCWFSSAAFPHPPA